MKEEPPRGLDPVPGAPPPPVTTWAGGPRGAADRGRGCTAWKYPFLSVYVGAPMSLQAHKSKYVAVCACMHTSDTRNSRWEEHTMRFHLCELQEQAALNGAGKNQNSGCLWRHGPEGGLRELSGGREMFCILIRVMVTQVYPLSKILH